MRAKSSLASVTSWGRRLYWGSKAVWRVIRHSGFEIEDLIEIYAPEGGTTPYPFVNATWARSWPSEEVWKARKWL